MSVTKLATLANPKITSNKNSQEDAGWWDMACELELENLGIFLRVD